VILIRFLAVSWIQGCFHWLSSPEIWLIKNLLATILVGAGVKGFQRHLALVCLKRIVEIDP